MEPSFTEPLLPRASELRRIQLRSRRLVTGDLLGQYRSAFRGTGLVYTDIREYLPGDDVKHIHWKATARTSKVFVKSYEEDRQLRVLLAVDASASMRAFNKTSAYMKALEFASTVGALTQQGNDLFGLSLFADAPGTYLPPKSGAKRTHQILAALMDTENLPQSGQTNLGAALTQISLTNRKPSIIFVLSDFFCPPYEHELRTLASVHDVVLVQIESSLTHVGELGLVTFADAETGEQVVIDTSNKGVRDAWNEHAAKHRADLRELAQSCRADHIIINDNALRPLVRLMKERTRRIAR
jgi:uncharacterized protein (DUF58 family)